MKNEFKFVRKQICHHGGGWMLSAALGLVLLLPSPAGAQSSTLVITNSSSGTAVSWPVPGRNTVLQWTPDLGSSSWSTFPGTPSVTSDTNQLFLFLDPLFQATNPSAFFRLVATDGPLTGPPTVATTPNTFTCNLNKGMDGTVQPNGLDTQWWFEWGPVGGPDTATTPTVISGGNNSPVAVETLIHGLAPGTTYHYQLYASNPDGTSSGGDNVFSTAPLPGAATFNATAIASTSAVLQGRGNPQGSASGFAGHFEWGLTTSYGNTTLDFYDPVANFLDANESSPLTGLQANTTYHYRIVVFNCSGESVGDDVQFTTGNYACPPPTVTTEPATDTTCTGATLNGEANPNGVCTTYYFEVGLNGGYGWGHTNLGTYCDNSVHNFQVPISGLWASYLAPINIWHFRLVGVSDCGTSATNDSSNEAYFYTTNNCTCQPPFVQTLPAARVQSFYADLVANFNPNGADTQIFFEWGTTPSFGNTLLPEDIGSGTTTTTVSDALNYGLTPSTTYYYRAAAFNSCGTNYGSTVVFTTLPQQPPVAVTLAASSVGATSAVLGGAVNPEGADTQAYFQYGLDANYGNVTAPPKDLGSGFALQLLNTPLSGLAPSTTYHYRAVASNSAGTTHGADATFSTP